MLFLNQDLFTSFLSLERKRSERTGQPFGLALLDVAQISDKLSLCNALSSHVRETDLLGWFRQESVAGIIFTALNGAPTQLVRSQLLTNIDNAMRSVLIPADRSKIPVLLRIYPEEVNEDLYPDLPQAKKKSSFQSIKRIVDISGSLMALILLSPVFLAISTAVKFSSPGPALFRQKRLGLFGIEFEFLKFRSMYTRNDPKIHQQYIEKLIQNNVDSSEAYKITRDPRVTPFGHFLRKTSLDELPQFWNVLKGQMSLVGPRPPIPYEMEKYLLWHRRRVYEAKPGITGLWQVNGRSRTTFDQMVRLDIRYIQEQSLWLDTKIALKTPFVIISGAGAY